jgi:hypothetical protein
LEELIDHVGEDRYELAPFENRELMVVAEVEEPSAELEARELPRREPLGSERRKIYLHGALFLL